MSDNWFEKLFINEAKPALERHEGGGGSGEGREPVLEEKEITENGVYTPPKGVDGFSKVDVDVPIPDGYIKPSGTKSINSNGTYDVTQYSSTNVNVPIPDGYIKPSGTKSINSNGTYDVTNYERATVEVASSGGGDTLKTLLDATKSTYDLFYNSTLTSVEGLITYNTTSSVTTVASMFNSCSKLTTVPQFDTSSATTMSSMFSRCSALTTVPQFDTSSVTTMASMFAYCSALTTVPQFDTSSVTNMYCMFQSCSALTTVPQFDTSRVTNMNYIFSKCSALTTVPQFDIRSVTEMGYMFQNCSKLTNCLLRNISGNLQVGSGVSYGHLLTIDSLFNLLNETRYYTSGTKTLTVGTANLAKFTGEYEYVKLTGEIVDVDDNPCEKVNGCKVRCTWCASTDEGAMTVAEYMTSKGWKIA